MKRRSLLAPLTALAVSAGLFSPALAAEKPTPSRNLLTQVGAALLGPAAGAVQADPAALRATYGFLASLPSDTESFSASYRLHDLWAGLANSKWATTLLNIPEVKADPEIQKIITQWNSADAMQIRALAEAILGEEVVVATPAGFSAKFQPLVEVYMKFVQTYFEHALLAGISGKQMGPQEMQKMMKDAAPELLPAAAKADVPPILLITKSAKGKDFIDAMFGKLSAMVGTELPPAFEAGTFKVGASDFKSITLVVGKLIPPAQEDQAKQQLRELLGDDAKATEVFTAIKAKRAELSWGWVGEYFVIGLGADHSHIKFAAADTDSVLTVPAVAARAGAYAAKKPNGLSYISKTMFDKFASKIEFSDAFGKIADELKGILTDEAIIGMKGDVKKLEGRAQGLFSPVYDAQVGVGWWEGGLHAESFGGYRNSMIDSSKPLALAGLLSPTTFALLDGRSSVNTKLTVDFLEDTAATVYNWYGQYGRKLVPEGERQNAAALEAMAIPLVKQAWNSGRMLGKALGDEAALIVDLDGTVPRLPDVPPFLFEGKIPRIAWVAELKDRAGVAESWKGFSSVIKQVTALLAENAPQGIPEPQMKKDGDIEIHFVPLPMETGDLLPHIAISKDRWILSTSPSFSKELAAKPAASGTPLGGQYQLSLTALWDFADKWLAVVDKNAAKMFGPSDSKEFTKARPTIGTALKLARSLKGIELRVFEEAGQARTSVSFGIEDVK